MQSKARFFVTAAAIFAATAVIIYLAAFDPAAWPSFKCPFHFLTGLDCPGCGTQRAIHSLFAGQFAQAWKFNPALFVAIPLAGIYAWCPKRLEPILYSKAMLYSIPAAIILWWILRNI